MSRRTEQGALNETMPDNPENENAAAKLWAVYVSEADKYDKTLVESWKSDMEGMLIFAGLFSASLTAFLIESYKTLVPDSGDTTVLLLTQISQQLAASANGTAFNFIAPTPFTPLTSSLVCNILWFISLGLSLTCALVATLLEQWARDFLNKTKIVSAPVVRARVLSYLYSGLKKFGMDTVVEIIPLLLHGSLLFFFAGLVAFLQPINTLVTAVTATILGTVTMIYASLTLVPLFHSDCPYRTPLSGGFWNLRKSLQIIFRRKRASTATMMEGVLSAATIPSTERDLRDDAALVWTVKSLTDTPELEPLIEALPDVLWGTDSRRHLYDRHIHRMIEDPGSDLLARVRDFRHNCHSRGLPVEVAKRHQISYYKAIWALGSLSTPGCAVQIPVPHLSQIDPQVAPYYSSARAIQAWADLCAAKTLLDSTLALLATYIRTAAAHRVPLIGRIHSSLQQLHSVYHLTFSDSGMFDLALGLPPAETLSVAAQSITDEITNLPLSVLLGYLAGFKSNGIPYRFDATQRLLSPPPSTTVSTRMLPVVESALYDIVRYNLTSIKEEEGIVSLDTVFGKVISYWEPRQGPFPWAVVEYLGTRKCDEAVRRALLLVPERAWQRLPDTILAGGSDHTSAVLNTIWRICAERLRSGPSWKFGDLATWEATLEAVWETGQRSPTPAVFAIVKHVILQQLERTLDALVGQDVVLRSNEPLRLTLSFSLAPECIVPDGASEEEMRTILRCRYALAELDNLTEFLQQCSSGHDALLLLGTTMGMIGEFIPRLGIHPEHQLRFATAVNKLFTQGTATTLLAEFSSLRIWWAYGGEVSRGDAWLDDEQARALVQETLRAYLNTLPLNNDLSAHVRRVVTSMDRLHGQ